jgi:hypothetical protein
MFTPGPPMMSELLDAEDDSSAAGMYDGAGDGTATQLTLGVARVALQRNTEGNAFEGVPSIRGSDGFVLSPPHAAITAKPVKLAIRAAVRNEMRAIRSRAWVAG